MATAVLIGSLKMGVVRARSGSRLGSYELGERLGAGGMAEVYVASRAGPHGFNKRFAIKLILPQLAQDPRFVQMFCDEARICAALTHPNIVQVTDFGESSGKLFMAMEYVDGISCAKLLRAVAARGERFPLGTALFIAHEVLRALSFAHEAEDEHGRPLGIVHRDVSPGNVLIGRAGEVKLTDFGIVRSSFIDRRTYPGELKGKMGYMSPEQVIGAELDARSDLFTVGIVLTEMLLCRPLFPGRSELDILSRIFEADLRVLDRYGAELPAELVATLRMALAREPGARFQTAREFGDAIRASARRAGVGLTENDLGPWLNNLGILASARSGMREAVSVPIAPKQSERRLVVPRGSSRPRPDPSDPALANTEPPPPSGQALRASSPVFHVRTQRGSFVGPLNLPQMLELVATGRVTRETLVTESGDERPAHRVDSLARLVARPAFEFARVDAERVSWQLDLERAALPGLLFELTRNGETGLLVFTADKQQKRVYLRDGMPVFISSTDRTELLGSRLVQAGLVTQVAIDAALTSAFQYGQEKLGEMLVARGLLRPTALLRALSEQLEQRFIELGTWTRGQIRFQRGEQSGTDHVTTQSTGPMLVTRLVREGYSDAELAEILGRTKNQRLTRGPHADTLVSELGLSAAEHYAVEAALSAPSLERLIAQLSSENALRPEQTLRAIFVALSSGVLATAV